MFDASPITTVEPVAEPAPKRRGRPRLEGRERFPSGQVRPAAQAPQQSAPELGKPSAKRLSADEVRRAGFIERILAASFAERPGGVGYFEHQDGTCCWPLNEVTPIADRRPPTLRRGRHRRQLLRRAWPARLLDAGASRLA
jgi:hypothetical protein